MRNNRSTSDHGLAMHMQERTSETGENSATGSEAGSLTAEVIRLALQTRYENLPEDVRRISRDCLLDWMGCALSGMETSTAKIVMECVRDEGGASQASIIGTRLKATTQQAAMVNATASHALDYDDVNLALPGHPSVAIIPGLLALAELHNTSMEAFLSAFVAGYEAACSIGLTLAPAHYKNGFHATATIGSLGATVACSHLLALTQRQSRFALGLAATQAAGLKVMFGSMAKPLHAGLAAQIGIRSSILAKKGFTSRADALECANGFIESHGTNFNSAAACASLDGTHHMRATLFKFHASCFSTHATIEAVAQLCSAHMLTPGSVQKIEIVTGDECKICNITSPTSSLEAKFSLTTAAALALLNKDTGMPDTWEMAIANEVQSVARKAHVVLHSDLGLSKAHITVHTTDGRTLRKSIDSDVPASDTVAQSQRVTQKFQMLTEPLIGGALCTALVQQISVDRPKYKAASLLQFLQQKPNA